MKLSVVLCWWRGWRPLYEVEHVNAMCRQLRAYLQIPFKIVLLTDEDASGAEVDELYPGLREIEGLKLVKTVNCFRRLRLYDPEYTEQFGTEWLMSVDLDSLFYRDMTSVLVEAMQHPYGLWLLKGRNAHRGPKERPFNGALQLIKHGAHPEVWRDFDPVQSPQDIAKTRWVGSDQSWLGIKCRGAQSFGREHGIYYFGQYLRLRKMKKIRPLMLNFAGRDKPWGKPCRFQAKDVHSEYMRWMDAAPQQPSTTASTN